MIRRLVTAYLIFGRTFGRWLRPLASAAGFCLLRGFVSLGMLVDRLTLPKLRRQRLGPLVAVSGAPRSGTTFLHRFLIDHGVGAGQQVWQMICPSLTLQELLRPLLSLLGRLSPTRLHDPDIHAIDLQQHETDDAAIFFRFFDGLFLYAYLLAWAERKRTADAEPVARSTAPRDFDWLTRLWRRRLLATRHTRIVAKMFSLAGRMPEFLRRFPQAKVVYLVRDPVEAVASCLSLISHFADARFGLRRQPIEVQYRYVENVYDGLLALNRAFCDDLRAGRIDADRLMVLPYPRLTDDFEAAMAEVLRFIGVEPDDKLRADIARTAERQRTRTSKHRYSLAEFGLDEERIRRDYGFFYETFDLSTRSTRSE